MASPRSQEALLSEPQYLRNSASGSEATPAPEVPEADTAEQRAAVDGDEAEDWPNEARLPDVSNVSEADAVEQLREVGYDDEEEYR